MVISSEQMEQAISSDRKPSGREVIGEIRSSWRTHPAEFLASAIFLWFGLLSVVVLILGRPGGWESLRYSLTYGGLWFLWMLYVIHYLPASARAIQFLRGFGPWVAVMLSYNWVRFLIPAVHPSLFDQAFRRSEMWLWAHPASLWTQALAGGPHWIDLFCLFYLGLFVWMFSFLFYYAFFRQALYQRLMVGLIIIYIGGFMGYMICPAAGPRYAFPQEWTWLNGGTWFHFTNWVVSHMGAKLDVFPSLHAAIAIFLFLWLAEYHPWQVFWGLPMTLGIWASTIFLGFHYFPDLVSGAFLGAGAFFLAPILEERFHKLKGPLP